MANEWSESSLGELIDVKHGFAFQGEFIHDEPCGDVLLTPGNFAIGGGFKGDKFKYFDGPVPDDFVLAQGDLLVTMTDLSKQSDTLGLPAFVPSRSDGRRYLHNQRLGKILVKDRREIDTRFLHYLMCSANYRHEVLASATGTTVKHTSPDRIGRYKFLRPRLPEQRAIAHILGTLDDKIELNRRMSETLEAMARALFKSWFVDLDPVRAKAEGRDPGIPQPLADLFPARLVDSELGEIPEGWEVGPLSTQAELMIGGDWGRDAALDGDVPIRCLRGVDIDRIRKSGWSDAPLRFISSSSLEKRAPSRVDVLVEGSGECGRAIAAQFLEQLYAEPVVYSNFCKRFRCSSPGSAFYVEFVLNELVRTGEMKNFVTGTAMPNLDHKGILTGHWVVSPPPQVLEVFGSFASAARRKLYCEESRALARLRDSLVPKLISGELRVEKPEKFIVAVGVDA